MSISWVQSANQIDIMFQEKHFFSEFTWKMFVQKNICLLVENVTINTTAQGFDVTNSLLSQVYPLFYVIIAIIFVMLVVLTNSHSMQSSEEKSVNDERRRGDSN